MPEIVSRNAQGKARALEAPDDSSGLDGRGDLGATNLRRERVWIGQTRPPSFVATTDNMVRMGDHTGRIRLATCTTASPASHGASTLRGKTCLFDNRSSEFRGRSEHILPELVLTRGRKS